MPYKLSASLSAHSADVRAVVSPTDDLILSASRDTTAIAWARTAGSSFAQTTTLHAGSRYINAVAYLPPAPGAPEGYAVTGGQDTVINVFALPSAKGEPNFSLLGHTDNVCALHAAEDGTIISGSWDKTAKVWKDFQLLYDLVGHQQSVWTVLAIDGGQFLTGSADNTIKLWKQHKNVRTYPGHTQAVRGLALITDIGFASCSNDSEIRIWTMEGDCVYTLSGHTSFVYSISVLPNGDIVSGGEDRTVRIWRDGECAQTLVHPAISVWTVSTMPNGDLVTGCSDGVVRVFSTEEDRWAPADQLKAYDELVAAQALPAQQVGDVNKSDLPGPEALTQPGKKPGEVKMIKRGETVEAHQWDNTSSSWQKIGDVVDAVGSGRKQLYQGREYDYVFDVDVQEGAPPLKLPYNANENPYTAAQRFLQNNDLPLSYLDEVVRFIEKNTAGTTIGAAGEQFSDPFTGASRYQASQAGGSAGGTEFMDPFTGASRYRAPAAVATPPPPVTTTNDPWTGASRYSSSATSPVSPPQPAPTTLVNVIPVRTPLSFRQAHVSAMQAKLYQFDQALRNEISTGYLAMYPQELNLIDETFTYLAQAVSHPLDPPSKKLTSNHIDAIIQLLERWPQSQIFPLMDLSRLVLAFCPTAYADPALRSRFFAALFKGASWNEPWSSPLPKQRETNTLFLLRSLANVFQDGTTLKDGAWVQEVLNTLGEVPYTVLTNSLRVSLTTILFNANDWIVCLVPASGKTLAVPLRDQLAGLILEILNTEKTEGEAAYRALVALGDIAFAAKEQRRPLTSEHQNTARQVLASLPATFPETRMRDVSKEVTALL